MYFYWIFNNVTDYWRQSNQNNFSNTFARDHVNRKSHTPKPLIKTVLLYCLIAIKTSSLKKRHYYYKLYFVHYGITSSTITVLCIKDFKEKYWKKYCQYKYSIPVFNDIFGRYCYWVFINISGRYWYSILFSRI